MRISILTLAAAGLLVGCGSATADVYLFDAVPTGVTGVTLQVKSIDVHVDADFGKAESVPADDTTIDQDKKWQGQDVGEAINLMDHQGESNAAFLGKVELPTGKITQLRLVLDLSVPAKNFVTFSDSTTCALDTTAVEKNGVKINHVFKVVKAEGGDEAQIFLHFDLANSLVASSSCFKITPVLDVEKIVKNGAVEPTQVPGA